MTLDNIDLLDLDRFQRLEHHEMFKQLRQEDSLYWQPEPKGTGFVTIRYKPGRYANITVDDNAIPGPVLKPRALTAGRHTIKFIEPQTGEVLDTQAVTIEDGKTLEVRQHE